MVLDFERTDVVTNYIRFMKSVSDHPHGVCTEQAEQNEYFIQSVTLVPKEIRKICFNFLNYCLKRALREGVHFEK